MSFLSRAYRHAAIPLTAYYTVTVAMPVANGAARSGTAFVDHALVVLVIPLVLVGVCAAIRTIWTRAVSACQSRRTRPRRVATRTASVRLVTPSFSNR